MVANHPEDDRTQSYAMLARGTAVSHYRIVERIGEGGMGEVYLAEDTQLQRKVALKFLPQRYLADSEAKVRFRREAQAAASLSHPNIIHIYEVAEFHDRPYFAMELVEGRSLRDIIHEDKLSLEQVLDIALQAGEGLDEAHRAGIVHRDIKPSNILVDAKGRVQLVDFGLARIEGATELTRTGSTLGTVGYMSPEQVEGKEADQRSDIFSLGVVLYEMLAGRQPFHKDSEAATLHAIVSEAPDPITRFRDAVPPEMQYVISRTLEKKRERRYPDVDGFLSDLKRLQRAMESGRPGMFSWRAFIPRRWSSAKLVGLFGMLVLVAGVLLIPASRSTVSKWFGVDQVPAEKHLAVLPFTNVGEALANQAYCDGLLETLTSKLTQMEQYQGSLRVVPASEVRERGVASAKEAHRVFGATLAVTGSVQQLDGSMRMTLNLVDTKTQRQLRSSVIDDSLTNVSGLQDSTIIRLAEMLSVHLRPAERHFLSAGGTTARAAFDAYLQGRGYLQRCERVENIDTAITLFQQALDYDARYALAYAGLGEAYWRKYKAVKEPEWVELAIYNSRRALELDDQLAPVYVALGLIHKGMGRYEEAVSEYQRALELDPLSRCPETPATDEFALDPVSQYAYRGLAGAYEALNDFDRAESTYQKAIELKPDYWGGYFDLGLFYVYQGRNEDALRLLHEVVARVPDDVYAYNDLGALYFFLEQRKDAGLMWERSLAIEPNYQAYSNLGTLHFVEWHYAEAARMYERGLELNDGNYQVWGNLASAYYWMPGEREKALATYERAIRMAQELNDVNPRDPVLLSDLAAYYAAIGQRNQALSTVEQALSLAPENIDVMVRAGLVYEELGERDSAIGWITRAVTQGFPRAQIESLPDLQELLADPRFEVLVGGTGDETSPDTGSK